MLLGVDGVCVISHGSSSAVAIVNAITVAHDLAVGGLVDAVAASVTDAGRLPIEPAPGCSAGNRPVAQFQNSASIRASSEACRDPMANALGTEAGDISSRRSTWAGVARSPRIRRPSGRRAPVGSPGWKGHHPFVRSEPSVRARRAPDRRRPPGRDGARCHSRLRPCIVDRRSVAGRRSLAPHYWPPRPAPPSYPPPSSPRTAHRCTRRHT
jgi:hypothetical protein